VRLDNLVNIKRDTSPSRIDRSTGTAGIDRASVPRDLRWRIASKRCWRGCADESSGRYTTTVFRRARELERTFYGIIWAFILSIIFMYMICLTV